jgi:4-amino-4-deoxy-L-arabinose transferase-like glycosyltransferase
MKPPSTLIVILFIAAIFLSVAIRMYRINEIGLSHYDSGVYAQSGLWPWSGEFHFAQGYFSPPLFPILIGMVNGLAGRPIDFAGPLLAAQAGIGMALIAGLIAREWFGNRAAPFAAACFAVDPGQILFSRIGLTDELFLVLLLSGFALSLRAIEHGGWERILAAGVLVGLAWNTKYHGFLGVAMAIGGLIGPRPIARLGRWVAIGAIAFLLYLPWALWFHVKHDYTSLIEHQRGYFRGLATWPEVSARGIELWSTISTPWVFLLPLIGLAFRIFVTPYRRDTIPLLVMACASLFIVWFYPFSASLAGLALLLILGCWGAWKSIGTLGHPAIPVALAVTLFLPGLYSPYARLWLPAEGMLILLACGAVFPPASETSGSVGTDGRQNRRLAFLSVSAVVVLFALALWPIASTYRFDFIRPRTGYRAVAREAIDDLQPRGRIWTLCRWPMNYYLALDGEPIAPVEGSFRLEDFAPGEVFLFDQTAWDTADFAETRKKLELKQGIRTWPIDLDLLTRLDDARSPIGDIENLWQPSPKDELRRYEP